MTTQPHRSESDDARLRPILDSSVDGILVLDEEGLIRFANPAAAGLWQRPLESLLGEPFGFPLLAGEAVILDLPRPDGTPGVVELHVVEINWEGAPAYLATLHDITARARESERLARINACFLSFTDDHDANINRLTALVGAQLNADVALYNRLDGALLYARGQWRVPSDYRTADRPDGHICYDVIRRGSTEPTVLHQLQASPYVESDASVRAYGLQTYVGQPVRQRGQSVGALCVVYQRDFHPNEADIKFLQLVANAVGVEEERRLAREALQAANAEQERIAAAEREQRVLAETLRDAAAALNSVLELDEVLDLILEYAARIAPHDAANIMVLEADGQSAFIRRSRGYTDLPVSLSETARVFMIDAVPGLRQMAETGVALLIPDTQVAENWTTFPETAWICSYLGIPLRVKGRVLGFLNLDSATPGFFTAAHAERLRAFADQVGVALENTELYAALRESERNLKEAQSIALLGRWELDLRANRLHWSDTIYEIFELDPAHFKPSYAAFLEVIHPDDREKVNQAYQTSLADKRPYNIEHRLQMSDGRIKWVHEACHTDYDENGQPLCSIGVVQDITERKRAEEDLLRNELRLQSLVSILQYRADNIQDYLDHVLEETLHLTESKIGYIYHYDEAQRQFVLNSWSREVMQECSVVDPQTCYALDATGIWGEAVRQRRAFIVNDFQAAHPFKKGYPQGHVQLQRYMTTPVFSDGKIVGVVGVANKESDYTESDLLQLQLLMDAAWKVVMRVQAERALQESEEKYRLIFELSPFGVLHFDTKGRITACNQKFTQIIGSPLERLIGLSMFDLPDQAVVGAVKSALAGQRAGYEDTYQAVTSGKRIPIRAHFAPILTESGEVLGGFGIVEDVSEREQAEAALRESEEKFRQITENIGDVVWLRSGDNTRMLYISPSYERVWGRTCQSLYENPQEFMAAVHPEDQDAVATAFAAYLVDGRFDLEYRILRPDGDVRWIHARAYAIYDAAGALIRHAGVATDITQRKRSEAALREGKTFLDATGRLARVGGWQLDALTREVRWTEETYRIHELPLGYQLPLAEALAFYHPEDRAMLAQALELALAEGTPFDLELRFVTASGQPLQTRAICHPQIENDKVVRLMGAFQDITALKQVEEALRAREHYLRAILQTTADGFWVINAEGKFADVNDAYCAMSGYSRAELQQMSISDIDALEDAVETAERIQRIVANGSEVFETLHRRKDGSLFAVEVAVSYLAADGGKLICFCRDITERKRAAETLRETRDYLENLLTYANAPIIVWNPDFVITRFNRAFEQLAGLRASQAIGQPLSILFPLESRDASMERIRQSAGERWEVVEIPILDHRTGETRIVLWNSAHILDEDKVTLKATIAQGTDITERKQVEAQLQEYTEHLEQLVTAKVQELELERAKVIQAGKLAALGEMATGVAHELNQPLTSLLLDAEYLGIMAERALSGEADSPPSLEEFLEISENQVRDIERCRRIIDHLRSFGRVSNETPVSLDMNQPIRDAFILIEQRLRQHDVTVEFALTEPLPLVLAHSQKLEQVFLNLISNAEYAMSEMARRAREGEVERPGYVKTLRIRSYTEGDHVCVAIGDNGSGMSPQHLERLFEPFFTTKPIGQGTGLGLSISYGLVAEFGGEITCESAVHEGTTFMVCLPIAGNGYG